MSECVLPLTRSSARNRLILSNKRLFWRHFSFCAQLDEMRFSWSFFFSLKHSRWFKGWFTCFKIPRYIIITMHKLPNNFWIFLLFPFHVPILINCILLVLCLPFSDLDLRRTALFLLRKTSGAAQCPFPAERHLYGTVSVASLYYVRGLKRKENWY